MTKRKPVSGRVEDIHNGEQGKEKSPPPGGTLPGPAWRQFVFFSSKLSAISEGQEGNSSLFSPKSADYPQLRIPGTRRHTLNRPALGGTALLRVSSRSFQEPRASFSGGRFSLPRRVRQHRARSPRTKYVHETGNNPDWPPAGVVWPLSLPRRGSQCCSVGKPLPAWKEGGLS